MPGIKCPACQSVDQYASHQGGPAKGDDRWERRKKCKVCGAIFITLEVPIGIHQAGDTNKPITPTATEVAPIQPVQPVQQPSSAPAVNPIFAQQPVTQ